MRNLTIIISVFITLGACSGIKEFMNPDPSSEIIEEFNLTNLPDSVYNGKYCIGPVKVVADVTVLEKAIAKIELLKHRTGQGQSAEQITEEIIEQQSVCLDAISGATISSICILKAVETALKNE